MSLVTLTPDVIGYYIILVSLEMNLRIQVPNGSNKFLLTCSFLIVSSQMIFIMFCLSDPGQVDQLLEILIWLGPYSSRESLLAESHWIIFILFTSASNFFERIGGCKIWWGWEPYKVGIKLAPVTPREGAYD